jgi:hypothetical protein
MHADGRDNRDNYDDLAGDFKIPLLEEGIEQAKKKPAQAEKKLAKDVMLNVQVVKTESFTTAFEDMEATAEGQGKGYTTQKHKDALITLFKEEKEKLSRAVISGEPKREFYEGFINKYEKKLESLVLEAKAFVIFVEAQKREIDEQFGAYHFERPPLEHFVKQEEACLEGVTQHQQEEEATRKTRCGRAKVWFKDKNNLFKITGGFAFLGFLGWAVPTVMSLLYEAAHTPTDGDTAVALARLSTDLQNSNNFSHKTLVGAGGMVVLLVVSCGACCAHFYNKKYVVEPLEREVESLKKDHDLTKQRVKNLEKIFRFFRLGAGSPPEEQKRTLPLSSSPLDHENPSQESQYLDPSLMAPTDPKRLKTKANQVVMPDSKSSSKSGALRGK